MVLGTAGIYKSSLWVLGVPVRMAVRIFGNIVLHKSVYVVSGISKSHLKNAFNVIDGLVDKLSTICLAFVFVIRDGSVMPRVTEANVAKYKETDYEKCFLSPRHLFISTVQCAD